MTLAWYRKLADTHLAQRRLSVERIKEEKIALAALQERERLTKQSQQILQQVAAQVQNSAHQAISQVVSKCIASVFPEDPYEFRILFQEKRGKTDAKLTFVRDGYEISPTEAAGIGCVDIAALGLRLICIILSNKRKLLILDEPFKNISPEYRELVPGILESLSESMECQIIFTTNFPEYACGKIIRLK